MLGKIALLEKDLKNAYKYFNNAESIYGCSYCNFLNQNFKEAKTLLKIAKNITPAGNWLLVLINLIEDTQEEYPTYFQIRNFYEQDMEMLFLYKRLNIIEKILKRNQYLENFNKEIYKYSGRILLNNELYDISEQLLKRSLNIYYKDPETHYLLGELYIIKNNITKAKEEFTTAIKVNKDYIPAINKLNYLNKQIV